MTDGDVTPSHNIGALGAYVEQAEDSSAYTYARELLRDLTYYSDVGAYIEINLFKQGDESSGTLKELLGQSILLARALRCTMQRSLPLELDSRLTVYLERAASHAVLLAQSLSLTMHGDSSYHLDSGRDDTRKLNLNLDASLTLAHKLSAQPTDRRELKQLASPALRLLQLQARLLPSAARDRYLEEWRAELHFLAKARTGQFVQLKYALRQLGKVAQLRFALRPHAFLMRRIQIFMYWTLTSHLRTWGVLGPLLVLAISNVYIQQGWGSAVLALPVIPAFHGSVKWLRKRLGIKTKRKPPPPK
ncbi:hypothetical protein ACWEJ6_47475 [Nonomuraea sp. NPDC004702]